MVSIEVKCTDCPRTFTISASEQKYFEEMNFKQPKRCKECRSVRKAFKLKQHLDR